MGAIEESSGETGPIPVWIDNTDRFDTIEAAVRLKTATAGDYRASGVTLVVDGLDELTDHSPWAVFDECRALVEALPETRILTTSRPLRAFAQAEERRVMPLLSRHETVALIDWAFSVGMAEWELNEMPSAISESVARPLFALLLGRSLAGRERRSALTVPTLLRDLATFAVRGLAHPDDVLKDFERLATLATDADGAPIPTTELGSADRGHQLLRSRLVIDVGGALVFALPVLREWFAAQAIVVEPKISDRLAQSELSLERWKYALGIALGQMSRRSVDRVMKTVVVQSPAFGSQLLVEREREWARPDDALALPDARTLGLQYRRAMRAMLAGLEPLSDGLVPPRAPRLPTLGVRMQSGYLVAAWNAERHRKKPKVVDLPPGRSVTDVPPGWTWLEISAADPDLHGHGGRRGARSVAKSRDYSALGR